MDLFGNVLAGVEGGLDEHVEWVHVVVVVVVVVSRVVVIGIGWSRT